MDARGWSEILFTIAITIALAWPYGIYVARVWKGESTWLDPVLRPVEGLLYKSFGVDRGKSQNWLAYTFSMLAFSIALCCPLSNPTFPGSAADQPEYAQ